MMASIAAVMVQHQVEKSSLSQLLFHGGRICRDSPDQPQSAAMHSRLTAEIIQNTAGETKGLQAFLYVDSGQQIVGPAVQMKQIHVMVNKKLFPDSG